jgi:hypothetical protein
VIIFFKIKMYTSFPWTTLSRIHRKTKVNICFIIFIRPLDYITCIFHCIFRGNNNLLSTTIGAVFVSLGLTSSRWGRIKKDWLFYDISVCYCIYFQNRKSHIRIHEDAQGGIYCVGVTTKHVSSLNDVSSLSLLYYLLTK